MRSITSRLVTGTSIVLAVFVVLVALSVSYSVHRRAETAKLERLQGLIYGVLGATDITNDATLSVNEQALPDTRLNQSIAGLYAELIGNNGNTLWQSKSTTSWLPKTQIRPIGDWFFETVEERGQPQLQRLQLSTAWAFDNGEEFPFIVHVVDEADSLGKQLRRFDQTLWATLLASAAALLIVQLLVLRRSLKPLHDIGEEIAAIERGERDTLSDEVPRELKSMTLGLNALLGAERQRHAQYRHLLDDLAHSLKTPLSVLQNMSNASSSHPGVEESDRETIAEQTLLMRQSIDRHSQRATFRSPRYLAPHIMVKPVVERISTSLGKLRGANSVEFSVQMAPDFSVRMDEADLFEVLGNILENACKYGAANISVSTAATDLTLIIEDDGPGFPDMDLELLVQRGVRADSQVPGTGMGLAAAQQLMASYGGRLEPMHGAKGGAVIQLVFMQ